MSRPGDTLTITDGRMVGLSDLWAIVVSETVVGIVHGEDNALQAAGDYMDDYEGGATEAWVSGPFELGQVGRWPRVEYLVKRRLA